MSDSYYAVLISQCLITHPQRRGFTTYLKMVNTSNFPDIVRSSRAKIAVQMRNTWPRTEFIIAGGEQGFKGRLVAPVQRNSRL